MIKQLVFGVLAALSLASAAMAQTTVQSRTSGSTYKATVVVPSTGNSLPGGSSSEATGMVRLNPVTGAAYTVPTASAEGATSLIVKAAPGNLVDAYCKSSVAGNCIVYNATTVPGAGALTANLVLDCVPVAAAGMGSVSYPDVGERFSAGIVVLFSSSVACNTYTASATAYLHARAQ